MSLEPGRKHLMDERLRKAGFSLTEIIVAVAILAIALVPSLGYLIRSMRQTTQGNLEVDATNIGASIIEAILSAKEVEFDELKNDMLCDRIAGVTDEDASENNEIKFKGVVYKIELKVTDLDNNEIKFSYYQTPHVQRQNGNGEYAETDYNDFETIQGDAKRWKKKIDVTLADLVKDKSICYMKDVEITVRWSDEGHEKSINFVTRRARLKIS
jgi:prepilin-type N-terminal cleavage/methylation domain-containing protein